MVRVKAGATIAFFLFYFIMYVCIKSFMEYLVDFKGLSFPLDCGLLNDSVTRLSTTFSYSFGLFFMFNCYFRWHSQNR